MERKEFLSLLGLGTAGIFSAACLGACSKAASGYTPPVPTVVDITLDLSLPANAALNNIGGYIYTNGVIVAKTKTGSYIAVSQDCTHQGVSVQYQVANQQFYCPSHGSIFSETGSVTGGPAPTSLKQYNTTLTNNMLRVYS